MAIKTVNLNNQPEDRSIRKRAEQVKLILDTDDLASALPDKSFIDMKASVEDLSDNEFDSDESFFRYINKVLGDANKLAGTILKYIKTTEISSLMSDDTIMFCAYTGWPNELYQIAEDGVIAYKLNTEQEANAQIELNSYRNDLDRLIFTTEYKTRDTGAYRAVIGNIDDW